MAEGLGPAPPKGLERFQDEITCPLCLGIYEEPKILPCQHIYCQDCLEGLAGRSRNGTVACPECRSVAQIPGNNVSTFPTAFHINRLKEVYEAMAVPAGESYHCQEHQAQALDLYCETCQQLVCRDCIIANCQPGGHRHGYVSKVTPAHREAVLKTLEPAELLSSQIAALCKQASSTKSQIVEQGASLSQEINRSIDVLISILEQQRQALLQRTEEITRSKVAAISAQEGQLRAANDELTEIVESTKRAVEHDSDKEFLLHKQKTVRKIKAATEKWIDTAQEPCIDEPIAVGVTSPPQLTALCKNSCIVCCKTADPARCTMSTETLCEAETGKLCTFTVRLADYQGHLCTEEQIVTAEFRRLRDGCVTSTEAMAKRANDYIFLIQPETRGRHELSVKVNGTHISNSPFPMFVRKPPKHLHAPENEILGLRAPTAMTCKDGKIYICEHQEDGAVVTLDFKFNRIASIQGLNRPAEIAIHQSNIYVSTFGDFKLYKFSIDGRYVKSVGGRGDAPGVFGLPNGIRGRHYQIFVCDTGCHRIQVFDTDLHLLKVIGKKGNGRVEFNKPHDLDFDSTGNMYVLDSANNRIQVLSPNGKYVRTIGKKGRDLGELDYPICIEVIGELLYVTDMFTNRVSVFHTSGELCTTFGEGYLSRPEGLAIDEDGFVYVSCSRSKVLVF